MQNEQAPKWMYPAGFIAVTLGALGAIFHTVKGEPLITYILDPLIVVGIPLGWYWLKRSQQEATTPVPEPRYPAPATTPKPSIVEPYKPPPTTNESGLNFGLVVGGIIGFAAGVVLGIAIGSSSSSSETHSVEQRRVTPPIEIYPAHFWSIGDTKEQVQAIEGRPDVIQSPSTDRTIWQYHLSDRVMFDDSGTVVQWRNSTGKLKVTIGPRHGRPERIAGKTFKRQSSMQEVLAALGMPSEVWWTPSNDRQDWSYPAGKVWFMNGLVDSWTNDLTESVSDIPLSVAKPPAPESSKSVSTQASDLATSRESSNDSPAETPMWTDYDPSTQGIVTDVAIKNGTHFFEAAFSNSTTTYEDRLLAVFRREATARTTPRFISRALVVATRGTSVVAFCESQAAEKGDVVILVKQ